MARQWTDRVRTIYSKGSRLHTERSKNIISVISCAALLHVFHNLFEIRRSSNDKHTLEVVHLSDWLTYPVYCGSSPACIPYLLLLSSRQAGQVNKPPDAFANFMQ